MKTAYTPGPWRVGGPYPSVSVCRIVAPATDIEPEQWEPICILDERTQGEPSQQALADAKAIAALPELIEALQKLCPLTHLDTCQALRWIPAAEEEREMACDCGASLARKAIAKALGGTP